ncbi:GerAB/ArcD/ProY family transporter [Paenibacillus sp. y28]|uniref:GerAB/ArcD/ProY family transporter n=1 Tax=Paenibacillus sp. y28 TaxID=3129110 RepID=UPI0030167929
MQEERISSKQLFLLLFFFIFSSVFITLPRELVGEAEHTGWLSIVIAVLVFPLCAWIIVKVRQFQGNRTIVSYVESLLISMLLRIVGKKGSKAAAKIITLVIFVLPTLIYCGLSARIMVELFGSVMLPETPTEVMIGLQLLLRYYMLLGGLAALARWSQLVGPLVIVTFLSMSLLAFGKVRMDRLLPLFDGSAGGVMHGSLLVLGNLLEVLVLMSMTQVPQEGKLLRTLVSVAAASGVMFLLVFFTSVGNYGTATNRRMLFPFIETVRDISFGNFLEHFELIALVLWGVMNFVKGALTFYACCQYFGSWFELSDYRPLMAPLSVAAFYFALLPQNIYDLFVTYDRFRVEFTPLMYMGIIVLLLLVSLVMRRRMQ